MKFRLSVLFFHTAQVDATSFLWHWLPGSQALTATSCCCCESAPIHQYPKHQGGSFQPSCCLEALFQEADLSWTQSLEGSSGPQWTAQVTCWHLFQISDRADIGGSSPHPNPGFIENSLPPAIPIFQWQHHLPTHPAERVSQYLWTLDTDSSFPQAMSLTLQPLGC